MIGPRPLVTLAEILAQPSGTFIRLSDLMAITGLGRKLLQREIEREHLRATRFSAYGCWFIARGDAIAYLERLGMLHAKAS
jgi:hypothetical protein